MTYDGIDGYAVLFGGVGTSNKLFGDTWILANGQWSKLSPLNHPGPRYGIQLAYDQNDGYVVAFGGLQNRSGVFVYPDQTWAFSGGNWTDLTKTQTSSPHGRIGASLAYDQADKAVILFGGFTYDFTTGIRHYYTDTWSFAAGKWSKLSTSLAPSHRDGAPMAYDATDGYLLLFGGSYQNSTKTRIYNDSWKFAGGAWTRLSPTGSPPGRANGGAAFDNKSGRVVLFGGVGAHGAILNDTWVFQNGTWTMLAISGPSARAEFSMAYDGSIQAVLLFGGFHSSYLKETWEFVG